MNNGNNVVNGHHQQTEIRQSDGRRRIQLQPINGSEEYNNNNIPTNINIMNNNNNNTTSHTNHMNNNDNNQNANNIQADNRLRANENSSSLHLRTPVPHAIIPIPALTRLPILRNLVIRPFQNNHNNGDTSTIDNRSRDNEDDVSFIFQATNPIPNSNSNSSTMTWGWSSITASSITNSSNRGGVPSTVLWRDRVPSPILLLSGSFWFCCAATMRGELILWSRSSGRRLAPTIIPSSSNNNNNNDNNNNGGQPAILVTDGEWKLLYVDIGGDFVVFDVKQMKREMKGSVSELLRSANAHNVNYNSINMTNDNDNSNGGHQDADDNLHNNSNTKGAKQARTTSNNSGGVSRNPPSFSQQRKLSLVSLSCMRLSKNGMEKRITVLYKCLNFVLPFGFYFNAPTHSCNVMFM